MTGYLGRAISQYARMQEPYPILVPLATCSARGAGYYLASRRLWSLLPLRRTRSVKTRNNPFRSDTTATGSAAA